MSVQFSGQSDVRGNGRDCGCGEGPARSGRSEEAEEASDELGGSADADAAVARARRPDARFHVVKGMDHLF